MLSWKIKTTLVFVALKAGNDSINVVWQSASVSLTAIVVIVFDQGNHENHFLLPNTYNFKDVSMLQRSFSHNYVCYCLHWLLN